MIVVGKQQTASISSGVRGAVMVKTSHRLLAMVRQSSRRLNGLTLVCGTHGHMASPKRRKSLKGTPETEAAMHSISMQRVCMVPANFARVSICQAIAWLDQQAHMCGIIREQVVKRERKKTRDTGQGPGYHNQHKTPL